MTNPQPSILQSKRLNGWKLFLLIVIPMCIAVGFEMSRADMTDAAAISGMIQFSVRLAVPWLFIAFAASSLMAIFPGNVTRWLLHDRRIFGLCFAAGMAWQLLFILWMVLGYLEYYMNEAYSYFDLSEQIPGYLILFAMTITSFRCGRSKLSAKHWKMLHKGGICFLWAVIWSTYWFELFYYDDIQLIDYVYYWMGFAAWGVRMVAWTERRALQPASRS